MRWMLLALLLTWATVAQAQVRPTTLVMLQATATSTVTASWDPNPPGDGTLVYRLYYGVAPSTYTFTPVDVAAPATSVHIGGLVPGTTYYFALQARAAVLTSALSAEVVFTPTTADPNCVFPLGADVIQVFPTALQHTGSTGAGSKARLDFQVGSPGSPVTSVAVQSNGVPLAGGSMAGTDLGALAGLWFVTPSVSGTYPLSIAVNNAYNCPRVQSTSFVVTVP